MDALWIPDGVNVARAQGHDAGTFAGGGHKLVMHTTEGGTLESVVGTLRAKDAWVHFVHDPKTGKTIQCLPLNRAGRGLQHLGGPETNRANAIQIELVGFAAQTGEWGDREYDNIASLSRAIYRRFSYPLKVRAFRKPIRFSPQGYVDFGGICGHCHVPGNTHWDPGTGFKGSVLLRKIKEGI